MGYLCMTMAAKALSPAEKKQLLKDPAAWVQQHGIQVGKRTLAEMLERRSKMLQGRETLVEASRELSRSIGEAKKQGDIPTELLERKRTASAREKAATDDLKQLDTSLIELLTPVAAAPEIAADFPPQLAPVIDLQRLEIRDLQAGEEAAWDAFVELQEDGSAYHLSGLRNVIEDSFGHESIYLIAMYDQAVVGVLPLVRLKSRLFGDFMVSQPYFNYGGVLALTAGVAGRLLSEAQKLAQERGCSHIEYRDSSAVQDLPVRTDKVAMWLDLPSTEKELWQQIGTKVRAQIKRSGRFGLTADVGGLELLDDFYQVFAENMRDLGTPVYGKEFFRNLLSSGLAEQLLVVVRHQGKPVSAAYLIAYKQRMEVPWASTLRSANRYDANMFLYWELLRQACSRSCTTFDFGRSTLDAATYRFKKQWGAQPRQLYWHYWLRDGGDPPKINPDNPKYKLVIAVWQRMPVWLTRMVGPGIVKFLP